MYDVAIIGGGPAAIFAAYEFVLKYPQLKVIMLEAGNTIEKRFCPLAAKKVDHCINCNPCSIMRGFGGAGAFSDGKYNFTTEFGGWLNEYLPEDKVIELIDYVDELNCRHGAPGEYFSTKNSKIGVQALKYDLHLLNAKVRHLGTENNLVIMENIHKFLEDKIEIRCNTAVEEICRQEDGTFVLELNKGEKVACKYLIAAPGRAGAEWYTEQCAKMGLDFINNQVDIGVRVEVPNSVMDNLTKHLYEAKMVYYSDTFENKVRTFCMNPGGIVSEEHYNPGFHNTFNQSIAVVNGHSYADEASHTENTNFAMLVSTSFTEPFNQPIEYGRYIAQLGNMLTGGGIMVQRLGDLLMGRRTDESRLRKSTTRATLTTAVPGDLSFVLPHRHLTSIIEALRAFNNVAPGLYSKNTLLYGVEVKFYSSKLAVDQNFETAVENFYAIGDGAGITRGLMQASVTGIVVARDIAKKLGM